MTWPDYLVLLVSILGIAVYGAWRSRKNRDLSTYLKGAGDTNWFVIGLSVMATQASAITFLSTPGQGYEGGLGFVQNYFGAPFALIVIAAVFLPIYRRLKVYTAYEYLGTRFDAKTRLLGAGLFLFNRGLGAGITIYAPAIVLSTVMGWRLDLTIIGSGLVVIGYTVSGGSDAVTHTQKYQLAVVFAGMAAAFAVLISKLPANVSTHDVFTVAGGFHKLQAVDFSFGFGKRYTFWSGVIGGLFLALSYFGTDQSQVQRYISGASLRESRMGLMFNAICKIPMQFFILLLGCYLFVFYQFARPPVLFNETAWNQALATPAKPRLTELEHKFEAAHDEKREAIGRWLDATHRADASVAEASRIQAGAASEREEKARKDAGKAVKDAGIKSSNDADYVFIRFIVRELPHGLIGLLMAAFFSAALSSKAAELNALGSTTTIDIYRHVVKRDDAHYYKASRLFTVFWGLVAIGFALFANLSENLIQATNILGSIFYGVILGIFLAALFFKNIKGTAIFIAAIVAQCVVIVCYFCIGETVTYLWYNVIGCGLCLAVAGALQSMLSRRKELAGAKEPVICFGQQPCGFFPKRFLVSKIDTARRLQREIGGEVVYFCHDSDHDFRETRTVLHHHKTGEAYEFNFSFENQIQRKHSPLYLKRVVPEWREKTARQLPYYVDRGSQSLFCGIDAAIVADFCLKMYDRMGLLDGIRVERSSDPEFRRAACSNDFVLKGDFFVDVPYQGEIVRARWRGEKLTLFKGGDVSIDLPRTEFGKEQISPARDSRFLWMQSVIGCTHYVCGLGEQAYMRMDEAPEVTFVPRDTIERSDEAYVG